VTALFGKMSRVTLQSHTSVNNVTSGASVTAAENGHARLDILGSTISRNQLHGISAFVMGLSATGIYVGGGAYGLASANTVARNNVGVMGDGSGTVYSASNSYLFNLTQISGNVVGFTPQ